SDDAGNADAGNNFIWLIWLLLDGHNNLFILTLLIYHNKRMRTKNTAISDLLAAVGIKITFLFNLIYSILLFIMIYNSTRFFFLFEGKEKGEDNFFSGNAGDRFADHVSHDVQMFDEILFKGVGFWTGPVASSGSGGLFLSFFLFLFLTRFQVAAPFCIVTAIAAPVGEEKMDPINPTFFHM
ncbi:hypothetical protein ACJX0J_020536, partial [Zea mays]